MAKNTIEEYDRLSMEFYNETLIWPNGKDRPAAMGSDDEAFRVVDKAYQYWLKAKDEITKRGKHIIECETRIKQLEGKQ